jgi:hypothetical protein
MRVSKEGGTVRRGRQAGAAKGRSNILSLAEAC